MKAKIQEKPERRKLAQGINLPQSNQGIRTKESVVYSMQRHEQFILLKDLLGNFSDQTGASFG